MIEPFMITNPVRKFYRFYFYGPFTDEDLSEIEQGVRKWLEKRGYEPKRVVQKHSKGTRIPILDYRVWLN